MLSDSEANIGTTLAHDVDWEGDGWNALYIVVLIDEKKNVFVFFLTALLTLVDSIFSYPLEILLL